MRCGDNRWLASFAGIVGGGYAVSEQRNDYFFSPSRKEERSSFYAVTSMSHSLASYFKKNTNQMI